MSNATTPALPQPLRRLLGHARIRGSITCRSGLHVGGSKDNIDMGETDNPVVRDPLTDLPYIPGSSLKGKLRALLEQSASPPHYDPNGEPRNHRPASRDPAEVARSRAAYKACAICRIFGPHKDPDHPLGPTRIIVRDGRLTEGDRLRLEALRDEKQLNFTELKTENLVLRTNNTARNPRILERIPATIRLELDISVRVFASDDDADDEPAMLDLIKQGLEIIQRDTFGGSGSRGSGWIAFDCTAVTHEGTEIWTLGSPAVADHVSLPATPLQESVAPVPAEVTPDTGDQATLPDAAGGAGVGSAEGAMVSGAMVGGAEGGEPTPPAANNIPEDTHEG